MGLAQYTCSNAYSRASRGSLRLPRACCSRATSDESKPRLRSASRTSYRCCSYAGNSTMVGQTVIDLRINRERHAGKTLE